MFRTIFTTLGALLKSGLCATHLYIRSDTSSYHTCDEIFLLYSSFSMERQLRLNDWVCNGVAHQFLLTTASFWKTQYVSPLVTFLWWYKDIQFTKIQTAKVAIFSHWSRSPFSTPFYSTHASVLWFSHKDCPLFGFATQNLPHRSFHKDHIIQKFDLGSIKSCTGTKSGDGFVS